MATLGEQAVGSIVKLNVGGVATNFIVVHQGLPGTMYDSSCDGTWLLMQDCYTSMGWDSTNNDYANSDIHSYLNNTFVNLLEDGIESVIKQVKIPFVNGTGGSAVVTGSSGLLTKAFLLSVTEVGVSTSSAKVEGDVLGYFSGAGNSERIAKLNGTAVNWWLRSPYYVYAANVMHIKTNGSSTMAGCTKSYGIRPAIVLDQAVDVGSDGTIMVGSSAITGSVNIGGVQRELTGGGYINIGGVLHELSDSQVNIGGTMKSLKG